MKMLIELESKIQALDKKNETKNNEVVSKYEVEIKEIKKKGEDKMTENDVKMSELKDNLNLMEEVDRRKLQFETELNHWQV